MYKYNIKNLNRVGASLNLEQEKSLSRKIMKGDQIALNELVEANLKLVVKIAWEFVSKGIEFEDLVQEGNIGLMTAAKKFDHNKNVRFSTYASWWIKQCMSRAITNKSRQIRIPYRKEELIRSVRAVINILYQEKLSMPSVEDIAEFLHLDRSEVVEILHLSENMVSLDASLGDEQGEGYEIIEDFTYSPERILHNKEQEATVINLLKELSDRERFVIIKRYGLFDNEKETLKTLSEVLGLSNETVRQIEIRSLAKLKTVMTEDPVFMAA